MSHDTVKMETTKINRTSMYQQTSYESHAEIFPSVSHLYFSHVRTSVSLIQKKTHISSSLDQVRRVRQVVRVYTEGEKVHRIFFIYKLIIFITFYKTFNFLIITSPQEGNYPTNVGGNMGFLSENEDCHMFDIDVWLLNCLLLSLSVIIIYLFIS